VLLPLDPPLLELLLAGVPLELPDAPLLDPAGDAPLELETPLLDPPVSGGGSPPPTLGSTRPMQPTTDRPAKRTGAT
jgi:hypothetical protein